MPGHQVHQADAADLVVVVEEETEAVVVPAGVGLLLEVAVVALLVAADVVSSHPDSQVSSFANMP